MLSKYNTVLYLAEGLGWLVLFVARIGLHRVVQIAREQIQLRFVIIERLMLRDWAT